MGHKAVRTYVVSVLFLIQTPFLETDLPRSRSLWSGPHPAHGYL